MVLQEAKKCKIVNKNKSRKVNKDLMGNKILQRKKIKALEKIAIKKVFMNKNKL
jgi:hypothetical protein